MNDEFQRQAVAVFQQWDSDLEKTKDQEEKLAVRLFLALLVFNANQEYCIF